MAVRERTGPGDDAGLPPPRSVCSLTAVEFAYRLQRWQRAKVVAEVPSVLDELEQRLRENSVPRPSGTDG